MQKATAKTVAFFDRIETLLSQTRAGMAILMGIIQVHLDKVMLSNFDTVLHGFGNIQKVLSSLGYKGEIYG